MNKKEWFELLIGAQNFDKEEFNKIVVANCSIEKGLMAYRNELLKQMDTPNFDEGMTLENVQKWFLEPTSEDNFDILMDLIEYNYWTIEELWQQCKAESIGIFTLVKCLNTNIKFEEGMKIYKNGKLINILTKKNEEEIAFIKKDTLFDACSFLNDLAYFSVPLALEKQIKKIRTYRMQNCKSYEVTKENVEYLTVEPMDAENFYYIIKGMEINNWTLKELLQQSLKTGFGIYCIVSCPNKNKVGA